MFRFLSFFYNLVCSDFTLQMNCTKVHLEGNKGPCFQADQNSNGAFRSAQTNRTLGENDQGSLKADQTTLVWMRPKALTPAHIFIPCYTTPCCYCNIRRCFSVTLSVSHKSTGCFICDAGTRNQSSRIGRCDQLWQPVKVLKLHRLRLVFCCICEHSGSSSSGCLNISGEF